MAGVELGAAYLALVPSMRGFAPAVAKSLGATESVAAAAGVKQGKKFGSGFTSGIKGMKTGALVVTAAVGGLVASSVNLEKQFSQSMNMIGANTGAPKKELDKLKTLAIDLGAKTSFSANEAADAMLELSKSGLKPATIQSGALAGTLQLAAAGGTSLESAATIASNALNTFNLEGKDMGAISAALAGGANASTASVESLGQALSQVGPGAKTAGLDLNETVGVLAAFDNAGIKGSDAGTSLKTMLTRLVPSTKKAREAMEELGLKFTDAKGNFVPISNVAQQLKDKLSGLSEEQRTTALNTIFGSDATRAATVLMEEGKKGVDKYVTATKDRGAAEKAADARMSGTAGALERLSGSWETFRLQLGLKVAPIVQSVSDKLGSLLDFLGDHSDVVIKAGMVVGGFAAAVLGLNVAIKVASAVTKAWSAITAAWTVVTKVATVATRALGFAIRFATGPIGLIITAITLAVGALVWFFTKTKLGKKIVEVVWRGIKTAIKAVADWWTDTAWPAIKKVITWFGEAFQNAKRVIGVAWGGIKTASKNTWDWIKKWVINPFKLALFVLRGAFNLAKEKISAAWGAIKSGLHSGWTWIRDNVFGKLKDGVGSIKTAFVNVKNGIKTAWNKLKKIAASPVEFILDTVYNDGIAHWWNEIVNGLKLPQGLKLPAADTSALKFARGGVLPGYTPGRDVHEFYSPTGGRLSLSGGEAIMRPEFTRAVGGAAGVDRLNAAARRGQAFSGGGVFNWLGDKWSKAWRGGVNLAGSAWDRAKKIGGDAWAFAKDPVGSIAKGLGGKVKSWLSGLPGGEIANAFGTMPAKVVSGIADTVKKHFSTDDGSGRGGAMGSGGGRGMGVAAQTAALRRLIPGAVVSSGSRPGAITATGYKSYHSMGRAIDIVSGSSGLNLGQIWDRLAAVYGRTAPELYYSGRSFLRSGIRNAPRSDHWDHVHWAMANGGVLPKLYDQGGWLPQGLSVVENRTGKPEPVLTGDQWDKVQGGGGGVHIGQLVTADMREAVREMERMERRSALKNNMGRGM